MCLTNCETKWRCVKQVQPVFLRELRFIFPANETGAGRLPCSRVIFLRQRTCRKQSSETEYCFPPTHPLRKITKPLSSPLKFPKIFSGVDVEKATLFQRLLSQHPHPSKIAEIVAGMIGKFRKMACHFAPDAPCPGTS